jgi:PAS domain S-box-containing protein
LRESILKGTAILKDMAEFDKHDEAAPRDSEAHIRALNARLEAEIARGRAERERLDLALNVSGVIGVWDGDLLEGKVYGDDNFARIYGMNPVETAQGKPLGHYFQFMHPEDVTQARAAMDLMMAGQDDYSLEHRIIRPDGSLLWVFARGRLIRGADGKPARFLGVSVDITGRKLAEERQSFLVSLHDIMRELSDPQEILDAAAAHLGRYLGASRIGYSELLPDQETVIISCGYTDGAPPIGGVFKLSDFGARNAESVRLGQTIVHDDVLTDPLRDPDIWEKIGTRGHVTVPLVRDGRSTGSLYVSFCQPHNWLPEEVTLIQEVAARIWNAAERGRAEAKLRDSEERFRLALESGQLGSWDYHIATGVSVRSLRHDRIFGYDKPIEDWGFERFLAHIAPEDRARAEASFRSILDGGSDWDLECGIIDAKGNARTIEVRAKIHTGKGGDAARILGTIADITDRKRAEEAALENAEQFKTFAQAMPNHVWTARPDGKLDWFNDRIFAYSGMDEAMLAVDGWAPIAHPDDYPALVQQWRIALASGRLYEIQCRLQRFDGVYRWHLVRAVPIKTEDGKVVRWIGTNTDIDDQKTTALALADLNATLEEQVRARTENLMAIEESLRQSQKMEAVGQLTGGLAHDFNNLLAGISGSLEQLEKRIAQGRMEGLDRYLSIAQSAAKRAASLTHRLLAFSRRQTLDPKPTDINRLVAGMGDLIDRTVGPSVAVEIVAEAELWATSIDPNQLENALLNLCINARDAMPDGGVITIETCNVHLASQAAKENDLPEGDNVVLCVKDTGAGMPPDVIERAFDPFFTTKPLGEGTGLGLSMVYGFVRQSGGQAGITSGLGQGTTICLHLPRFLGSLAAPEKTLDIVKKDHRARQGETVLVVDDEPDIRALIVEVLRELGYTVIDAPHAQAGLDVLKSGQAIDLLITDIGLPGGMNGRQFAGAARINRPGLKILLITGYAQNAISGDAQLGPGMHILMKPFALQTLAARIQEILG